MGLGSILGGIGAAIAAPFTGGTSLAALPAILGGAGAIGDVLGSAASGRAAGRAQESQLLNARDMAAIQRYIAQQNAQNSAANLDLSRKQFTENARGSRAKQALIGDLLGNVKDVNVTVPGIQNAQISGGLRPSALGETGRQSAAELAKQALLAQMTPDKFIGGEILKAPELSALPQANALDKILGIGGLVGSLGGALGSILPPPAQPLPVEPTAQAGLPSYLPSMPGDLASYIDPRVYGGTNYGQGRVNY